MSLEETAPARRRAVLTWIPAAVLLVAIGGAAFYYVFRESDAERLRRLVEEGRRAMEVNDFATTQARLEEALAKAPNDAILLHNLAVAYARQNRIEEARNHFERAARAHVPEANELRAEEYLQLATLSVQEKAWERAMEELRQAIAAHPTGEIYHARLLDLQLGPGGSAAGADSVTAQFLRLCGPSAANLSAAAYVHYRNRSYPSAEALAREAIALSDSAWDAHATLARSLGQTGRPAEGLRHLDAVLERQASVPDLWVAKTQLHLKREMRDEALAAADRAVQVGPRDVETHRVRQLALGALGRYDEAIEELESARDLTRDPGLLQQLRNEQRNLQLIRNMQNKLLDSTKVAGEPAP